MKSELSQRKHDVLLGAVEDYINDASPITSGSVKEKHIKDISTATLRNELNALEAMGYLKQLHTSGGRVPTILAYRYYVNELLKNMSFDETALEQVKTLLENRTNSLTEIVAELAKLISKVVNYPTVVLANGYDKLEIKSIKVFPLVDKQALTLIQTESGYITNTIKSNADMKSCDDASKYLTKRYEGRTIREMIDTIESEESEMLGEIEGFRLIVDNLINGMKQVLESQKLSISRDGSANMLTDNTQVEETRKVLKLLDNEQELEKTIDLGTDSDLTISLVEEDEKNSIAIVKAPIVIDGKAVATIGVLGPQRMNYANIASALKVVMEQLSSLHNHEKGE